MIEPIMQFFDYAHLPEHLGAISAPFGILAQQIVDTLPRNPERTVALRKLLEAKDAAVRAKLFTGPVMPIEKFFTATYEVGRDDGGHASAE